MRACGPRQQDAGGLAALHGSPCAQRCFLQQRPPLGRTVARARRACGKNPKLRLAVHTSCSHSQFWRISRRVRMRKQALRLLCAHARSAIFAALQAKWHTYKCSCSYSRLAHQQPAPDALVKGAWMVYQGFTPAHHDPQGHDERGSCARMRVCMKAAPQDLSSTDLGCRCQTPLHAPWHLHLRAPRESPPCVRWKLSSRTSLARALGQSIQRTLEPGCWPQRPRQRRSSTGQAGTVASYHAPAQQAWHPVSLGLTQRSWESLA